jgi:hypothetical protein
MNIRALAAGLALLTGATTASAQFALVPAQPNANDPVVVRMTVDSCVYDPDRIDVQSRDGTFIVVVGLNACLVAGPTKVIDVRLGTLPAGSYRWSVQSLQGDVVQVILPPTAFSVLPRPTIAIFPPPKKPLNDYTGNWIVPTELGWGLTILQSPAHTVFAQLFVYGANRLPEWFTFQAGQWKSATRWEGAVYASTGPAWSNPAFDPAQVSTQPVGTATLEFEQLPGSEGLATLVYTVGGASVTKRIRRFAF